MIAADPLQRQRIAHLFGLLAAGTANRIVRIIVDLASFDDRYAFIQKTEQAANDSRFALAALTEENHMVAGENGILDLRYDGFVITDDARQDPFAAFHVAHEILAHFIAHR